jgi:hypothetical protein
MPKLAVLTRLSRAVRRRAGAALLWLLTLGSAWIALATSPDQFFTQSTSAPFFPKLPLGNQLAFDLAVGVLVSVLFYVLVVWLPQRSRRRRLRRSFERHFQAFKEACIYQFLFAAKIPADPRDVERLCDVGEFKRYFKQKSSPHTARWDDVFNGLEDHQRKTLLLEMGLVADEARATLASIDVEDDDLFYLLKGLTHHIARLREAPIDDHDKALAQFLWQVFAAWSWVTGYRESDVITDRLRRL